MTMKLLGSTSSPFVRKTRIAAAMKGLADRVELVPTDTIIPCNDDLIAKNPLAKIPALILEDGTAIFDSHVICEYLDGLKPEPKLFPAWPARLDTLRLAALADGVLEAAVLIVYEKRFRPEEKWVAERLQHEQAKIDAALDHLEPSPPAWRATPDYGHVTLASALGYLDFRHEGKWRGRHPNLVAWLDRFTAAVPSFNETRPG